LGLVAALAPSRSKATGEKQYNENDQYDPHHSDAAVTIAITVAAKASTEAPKQKNYEYNDEYESDGHDQSPFHILVMQTKLASHLSEYENSPV